MFAQLPAWGIPTWARTAGDWKRFAAGFQLGGRIGERVFGKENSDSPERYEAGWFSFRFCPLSIIALAQN
jgi:hypothetical protein